MAVFAFFFLAALGALLPFTSAIELDVGSKSSIKAAARTMAFDLMTYYTNNRSSTPAASVGTLPLPYYWWEAGAVWGGLIDYWAYTGDSSYNPTVKQALLAQIGPDKNYMPPAYFSQLGNDDQAFWAIAALNAHEYDLSVPTGKSPHFWVDLAEAVFNTMVPRWFTTKCNGGLQWQIFKSNPGWGYKNSISNGGFLQIAARLARATGNETYVHWGEKVWDWMEGVKLIDGDFNVWDGAEAGKNCSDTNRVLWTYNPAILMYGAATMHNVTADKKWAKRTEGLVAACKAKFFSPYKNSTDIMFERACEPQDDCDDDQYSFKAYLSRWMAQSALLVPDVKQTVTTLLTASAKAAAKACSGGKSKTICGQKWYVGGFDGSVGVGQQLSALETVQALLLLKK